MLVEERAVHAVGQPLHHQRTIVDDRQDQRRDARVTALALLLFAVFFTRPAPLCVLDEVDAPLDDANVERLITLLEELARAPPRRASSSSPIIR